GHVCTRECLRIVTTPTLACEANIKRQPSNVLLVVDVLCLACVRISSERANRVDSACDCRSDEILSARWATRIAVQICAWRFVYARDRRAVGSSRDDSNARTILCRGNRST